MPRDAVNIRITPEQYDRLEAKARGEDRSVTNYARRCVLKALEKGEDNADD
jgi:hypothetical protein